VVILVKRTGQLGNRLFLFAHFLANAAEYGYELVNPSFGNYSPYFEATATGDFEGLPVRMHTKGKDRPQFDRLYDLVQHPRAFRLLRSVAGLLPGSRLRFHYADTEDTAIDLNDPAYLAQARKDVVLAHGWLFRDKRHFAQHGELIRRLFAPVQQHRLAVAALLSRVRQQADVVVGVHIRRGDYAGFAGGAYFYDNATYARAMRELRAQLPAHQRVAFLLCSNEPIVLSDFAGLDVHLPTGHFVEDLYALAGCDYLLGPPSSYSMWASFYGEVPLLHLHTATQPVPLTDFTVFLDQEPEPVKVAC
jgi:hypothetical protein